MGEGRCTAKAKTTGARCRRAPAPGCDVCVIHGAGAPAVREAGQRRRERAEAEVEWSLTFGDVDQSKDVDLVGTVLGELRWCSAHVAWLRARVHALDPEAIGWGIERRTVRAGGQNPGTDTVRAARPHVYVTMLGEWVDRLARVAAIAGKLGVEQRYVELAERTGTVIADVLSRVLDDIDLTGDQRAAATAAVPRHLRLVGAALNGESA